jgi:hypothetical protein
MVNWPDFGKLVSKTTTAEHEIVVIRTVINQGIFWHNVYVYNKNGITQDIANIVTNYAPESYSEPEIIGITTFGIPPNKSFLFALKYKFEIEKGIWEYEIEKQN